MKLKALLLTAVALFAAAPLTSHAQNVIWDYTALGAAPASNDLIFIKDVSASVSKTITVANLFTSPTLVTPTLGVATATTINKVTLTAPATGSTLTIADGKVLTISNTLIFTGTDSSSVAFGTGGTVTYTANNLSVFAATTSAQLAGVISNETGTGVMVLNDTPTLITPVLGVATATTINKVTITAPATGATLTIADGKVLTASNTLTFTGTDSTSFKFPATSNTVVTSSLTTNDVDAANAIWLASSAIVLEGAAADAHEGRIIPADFTADVDFKLPDAAAGTYALMMSTLATNAPGIANSVTAASNELIFEGTADAHEHKLTSDDATADVLYKLGTAPAGTYNVRANVVEARTATVDGTTTGTISAGVTHVTVTSDSADKIIILPAPVVGAEICIDVGATGFELRSSAPETVTINGGSGADAESAIAANSTLILKCVSATAWKGVFMDADGDVAKIEAAAP